jgi:hypothetical protein
LSVYDWTVRPVGSVPPQLPLTPGTENTIAEPSKTKIAAPAMASTLKTTRWGRKEAPLSGWTISHSFAEMRPQK